MRRTAEAKRLAKALMDVGVEEGEYRKYSGELKKAVEVFGASPELGKALLNPMHKLEERVALMDRVSDALELSPAVASFLGILVSIRKVRLISDVLDAFIKLEDEMEGRTRATVESPHELNQGLLDEIKKKLAESTGREVIVAFRQNPALLGGLVIRMENTVMDGSIKTQLDLMKEKILEGVV
jgi:F-type H+-transporting ATPase subunit delta